MREDQAHALNRAIESGDEAAVAELLRAEPRLTGTPIPIERAWGEEMWLGLHRAAELGVLGPARVLLDAGASVDSRTRYRTPMHGRETALLIAARCGHDELARLLLERGACPDLPDATHRSALSHAAGVGHTGLVVRLIEAGAGLDLPDDQQRTALHWAIQAGQADAALVLIDAGADINHRCPKEPGGFTPLHRCVSVGSTMRGVFDRLIEAGADRTLKDPRDGRTADELAGASTG